MRLAPALALARSRRLIHTPRACLSVAQGKRLNSPNDLAFAANGDLYFTDPSFGFQEKENYRLAAKGSIPIANDFAMRCALCSRRLPFRSMFCAMAAARLLGL